MHLKHIEESLSIRPLAQKPSIPNAVVEVIHKLTEYQAGERSRPLENRHFFNVAFFTVIAPFRSGGGMAFNGAASCCRLSRFFVIGVDVVNHMSIAPAGLEWRHWRGIGFVTLTLDSLSFDLVIELGKLTCPRSTDRTGLTLRLRSSSMSSSRVSSSTGRSAKGIGEGERSMISRD